MIVLTTILLVDIPSAISTATMMRNSEQYIDGRFMQLTVYRQSRLCVSAALYLTDTLMRDLESRIGLIHGLDPASDSLLTYT